MRVRIIQNTRGPECWYADRVGEAFDVRPYYHFGMNTGDWVGHSFDGSGQDCLIASEDCEELDELKPKAGMRNLKINRSQYGK